ncbi:MAG: hypothetical protein HQ557_05840, partial [Bacteroidetes bacterium]|nr:hypothetical protein [Bacteroidota bacterium]
MKILLIAPHAQLKGYSRLFFQNDEVSLGLLSIEAMCKQNGHTTRLMLLQEKDVESAISEYRPEIVGITSMTPTYLTA